MQKIQGDLPNLGLELHRSAWPVCCISKLVGTLRASK